MRCGCFWPTAPAAVNHLPLNLRGTRVWTACPPARAASRARSTSANPSKSSSCPNQLAADSVYMGKYQQHKIKCFHNYVLCEINVFFCSSISLVCVIMGYFRSLHSKNNHLMIIKQITFSPKENKSSSRGIY